MCVAAIVYEPVKKDDLLLMEKENPHGGGVAWYDAEARCIWFHKGITAEYIFSLQQSGALSYPYLLHFRWATHGEIVPALAHPFVTGPRALMGEVHGKAQEVMIHNGVWNDYRNFLQYVDAPKALIEEASDTAIAAALFPTMPHIARRMPWAVITAHVDTEANAMAVVQHTPMWQQHEGNTYSNLLWMKDESQFWRGFDGTDWSAWAKSSGNPYLSCGTKIPMARSKPFGKPMGWDWDEDELDPQIEEGDKVNIHTYEDWTDYIRARYGDEVADSVRESELTMDELESLEASRATADMARDEAMRLLDETEAEPSDEDNAWDAQIRALNEAEFDEDLVSDQPDEVNAWLGIQEAKMRLKAMEG